MRRDTQIGIILGIVILVIIGVFLSTRTNVIEPQISNLVLSEGSTQQREIEEININDLIEKSRTDQTKVATSNEVSTDVNQSKEEVFTSTQPEQQPDETFVETLKDNTSLEGKWEGIPEEKLENSQITEELQFTEEPDKTDESQIAEEIPFEEEEEPLPEDEQQVVLTGTLTKTIHKVKPNESLFKIAKIYFGDETKWYKIYEENKDKMSDPNSLYVGQQLLIPDISIFANRENLQASIVQPKHNLTVNTVTHKVQSGDSLYRIAEKYYGDPANWKKIYKANEEKIEDQGLLRKGQILVIP